MQLDGGWLEKKQDHHTCSALIEDGIKEGRMEGETDRQRVQTQEVTVQESKRE